MNTSNRLFLFSFCIVLFGFSIPIGDRSHIYAAQSSDSNVNPITFRDLYGYIDWSDFIEFLNMQGPGEEFRPNIYYITTNILSDDVNIKYIFKSFDMQPSEVKRPDGYMHSYVSDNFSLSYSNIINISTYWDPGIKFLTTASGGNFVSPWEFDHFMPFITFKGAAWASYKRMELISFNLETGIINVYDMSPFGIIAKYYCDNKKFYIVCQKEHIRYYFDITERGPIALSEYVINDHISPYVCLHTGVYIGDGSKIVIMNEGVKEYYKGSGFHKVYDLSFWEDDDEIKTLVYDHQQLILLGMRGGRWRELNVINKQKGGFGLSYLWQSGVISYDWGVGCGKVEYYNWDRNIPERVIELGDSEYWQMVAAFDKEGNGIVTDLEKILIIKRKDGVVKRIECDSTPALIHERGNVIYIQLEDGGLIEISAIP